MANIRLHLTFALLSLALVLALAGSLNLAAKITDPTGIKSLIPEMSSGEIKTNVKLFLTKVKVRRVPLAKKRSETLLAKLYTEERIIQQQIDDLKRNLKTVGTDPSSRQVLDTRQASKDGDKVREAGNLMVVSELTESRIEEWRTELANKEKELEEVAEKKDELKSIIKNPESYISIPTNYGREPPEVVQKQEQEILITDRINMDYRARVEGGEEEPPSWLEDEW